MKNGFRDNGRDTDGTNNGLWDIWSEALQRLLALYPNQSLKEECRIFVHIPGRLDGPQPFNPKDECELTYILICCGIIGTQYQHAQPKDTVRALAQLAPPFVAYIAKYAKSSTVKKLAAEKES